MDEDFALRQAHPLYRAFCREAEPAYDPDGGFYDYEADRWESYDDFGGPR